MDIGYRYEISLQAYKLGKMTGDMCTINVVDGKVPSVEILELEQPVNSGGAFEIVAKIGGLKTGCFVEWSSVDMENYEVVDLKNMVMYY